MRWCRIRFVLLGLLLCVVDVVSGTCGQRFTDPASSALLSDVVIEGKVRKTPESQPGQIYNITVAIRKKILKGAHLVWNGSPSKKITIARFKKGGRDLTNCVGSVQEGRTYFFFLKDISDPKGLHFEIVAMPIKKTKNIATELRKILCENCARTPSISTLTGPDSLPTGNKATLKCEAEAKPNPEFSWYKDGVLLPATKRGHVKIKNRKRQSTLQIKRVKQADAGTYECVADNAVGKARSNFTVKVLPTTSRHYVPCLNQTYCLNGGTCYIAKGVLVQYCRCPEQWAGRRCELLDAISVREDYNHQATILFERTLIIIGIVIALLVFIVICIASYVLAKNRRKRFEDRRRKRRETQNTGANQPSTLVDRSIPQNRTNKESEKGSENIPPNLASKQLHQIMLHNSSLPATNQPHGHTSHQQQSDMKVDPNGYKHESLQRMAESSDYENLADSKLSAFSRSEDFQPSKSTPSSAPPETIEMSVLQETNEERSRMDKSDRNSICGGVNSGSNNATNNSTVSVLPDSVSSLSHPSHICNQISEASPHTLVASLTSPESQPSSLTQATHPFQQIQNDASPTEDKDTAVYPLLSNHDNNFPIENFDQPVRPFQSRSDKDLYKYLLLGSIQDIDRDKFGLVSDNPENPFMALTHSNTFPVATKMNGLALDMYSESDEEDETEVPYEKQLHISEEDLAVSYETLENSLFLGENTPTRERCREDWVIGLIPSLSLSRPGMRKYQSEEGPVYSRLVNKSIAYLEDNARSRSLDEPSGLGAESCDHRRMNSTMAGSPDVETYDHFLQQPPQSGNSSYAYDPNDDSPPWEEEMENRDLSNQTAEDRDKLNCLKDVLPDQQPIPV